MTKILNTDDEAMLQMKDVFDPEEVRRVLGRLQEVRDRAYNEMRSVSQEALTTRPEPERWSAIEHLRHLVFAEDLYLNRWILRNSKPWIQVGLLPNFWADREDMADVGKDASEDLELILSAWADLHENTKQFVSTITAEKLKGDTSEVDCGQGTVGGVLRGLATHDFWHLNKIEGLLNRSM